MDEQNSQNNGNYQDNTSNVQNPAGAYGYTPEPPKQTNVLAIISMVAGILSIIMSCCYVYAGLILGIAGLICAILSRKQGKNGMGTAGLVCSIIGLVLSIVLIILAVFVLASVGGSAGLMEMLQQYQTY